MITRRAAVASLVFASFLATTAWAQAPKPPSKATPARPDPIRDFIMLVDGEPINGDVKTEDFVLKWRGNDIPLKKKDMATVEYRKPPNKMQDEVQMSDYITRLYGDLQPAVIKVEVNGKVVSIPKTDILAIMFMRPIETVSEPTRKALGRK